MNENEIKAYEEGKQEAIDTMKRIYKLDVYKQLNKLFPGFSPHGVISEFSMDEIEEKLEEFDKNVSVGDEVCYGNSTFWVTHIVDGHLFGISPRGISANIRIDLVKRTGDHDGHLEELLKESE